MKINGKAVAEELLEDLKKRVEKLKEKKVIPHMYIITFGENSRTNSYLNQKLLRAGQIGARITIKRFPLSAQTKAVDVFIEKLNKDKKTHGIIVQRPLNKNLNEESISLSIIVEKDVDGFHPHSPFGVPVALAVIKLIETTLNSEDIYEYLQSKKIVILGKGVTAGGPTIRLLEKLKIKVAVIDSKTKNREKLLKSADIVISAVGKTVISKNDIKKGALLIGIGMHMENDKLKGDYLETDIENKVSFYTPTPGGVGPVNVAMLMKNLVEATENQTK